MMRRSVVPAFCCAVIMTAPCPASAQPLAAEELLEKSIAYHDPNGVWEKEAFRLTIESKRPEREARRNDIVIDVGRGRYELHLKSDDGQSIEQKLVGDSCTFTVNGSTEVTPEQIEKYRLDCDSLKNRRNYHTYLWGLPMKLRDPGTLIDPEVRRKSFRDRDVLVLRVTYEPEVGEDIWYMYFDPETSALVAFQFYKNEEKQVGEYTLLRDEIQGAGLRLPQHRDWHMTWSNNFVATESLIALEKE